MKSEGRKADDWSMIMRKRKKKRKLRIWILEKYSFAIVIYKGFVSLFHIT